jgi:crotonobetainyl-CoA:carnitine CoA-transferase CaiB-like acyl-CoA transferase
VLSVAEALTHPQFVSRGMSVHADGVWQIAPPVKLSGWQFAVERHAPSAGEHSVEILQEAGYGDEEITSLQQCGAV